MFSCEGEDRTNYHLLLILNIHMVCHHFPLLWYFEFTLKISWSKHLELTKPHFIGQKWWSAQKMNRKWGKDGGPFGSVVDPFKFNLRDIFEWALVRCHSINTWYFLALFVSPLNDIFFKLSRVSCNIWIVPLISFSCYM